MAVFGMGQSAQEIGMNYLNLLITQLRNQNPMEPMDNSDMSAQLASLGQLEQVESMNRKFDTVLESVQVSHASALIGREVSFYPKDSDTAVTGEVSGAVMHDGTLKLKVGEDLIAPSDVISFS
jgi:flagellar basal-body rod modification protein FlgD